MEELQEIEDGSSIGSWMWISSGNLQKFRLKMQRQIISSIIIIKPSWNNSFLF